MGWGVLVQRPLGTTVCHKWNVCFGVHSFHYECDYTVDPLTTARFELHGFPLICGFFSRNMLENFFLDLLPTVKHLYRLPRLPQSDRIAAFLLSMHESLYL